MAIDYELAKNPKMQNPMGKEIYRILHKDNFGKGFNPTDDSYRNMLFINSYKLNGNGFSNEFLSTSIYISILPEINRLRAILDDNRRSLQLSLACSFIPERRYQ